MVAAAGCARRCTSDAREVVLVALLKSSSRAMQRQVDLATAVCQERLLATHVRHVIAFVDLVSDRLAFDDALDIYVRVLRLTPEQARNVGSRALAELGRRDGTVQRARRAGAAVEVIEPEDEPAEPEPRVEGGRADALFGRLRRRVRGRVQDELRERINLSAARTEDELLETHVQNALIFVRTLGDETAAPDATELYLDTMMLPEGMGDVIYNRALRTLADKVLPAVPAPSEGPEEAVADLMEAARPPA
jgi:hypothetical protein